MEFTLPQLQSLFFEALQGKNDKIFTWVNAKGVLNPSESFSIYRDCMLNKLIGALVETYPVCYKLVGDLCFNAMGRHYIQQFPSNTFNLNKYGENFSEFIQNYEPVSTLLYLSDVARLEWAFQNAHCSNEAVFIDKQEISQFTLSDLEQYQFKISTHSTLLISEYPIYRIWQVNRQEGEEEKVIHLDEGKDKLFIYPKNQKVAIFQLDNDADSLLLEMFTLNNSMQKIICRFIEFGWLELILPIIKKMLLKGIIIIKK